MSDEDPDEMDDSIVEPVSTEESAAEGLAAVSLNEERGGSASPGVPSNEGTGEGEREGTRRMDDGIALKDELDFEEDEDRESGEEGEIGEVSGEFANNNLCCVNKT